MYLYTLRKTAIYLDKCEIYKREKKMINRKRIIYIYKF